MITANQLAMRLISGALMLALSLPGWAAMAPPQDGSLNTEAQNGPSTGQEPGPTSPQPNRLQPDEQQLPDSPGAGQSRIAEAGSQGNSSDGKDAGEPTAAQTKPDTTPKPVGTAAAETSRATGFAVAKPSGAAMAPAKPKRVRTIVIGVAAVIGAGVAVGTVAALSRATPSKPPGSR